MTSIVSRKRIERIMHATTQRAREEATRVPSASAIMQEYLVCCLPEDHINYRSYVIRVERRSHGLWAIERHRQYLGSDGTWSYREETDAWLNAHRFDLKTALLLAKEQAPLIATGGCTVTDQLNLGES